MEKPTTKVFGVCECCGTKEGIRLNGSTPQQQVCGPTTDCERNRQFRMLMKECIHRDYVTDVCEAFGITGVDVDDKDEENKTEHDQAKIVMESMDLN